MIGDMKCEKCGDEIQRPVPAMEAIILIQRAYSGPQADPIKEKRILCPRCAAELVAWMEDSKIACKK